jgi:hypothetical protein
MFVENKYRKHYIQKIETEKIIVIEIAIIKDVVKIENKTRGSRIICKNL